MSGVDTDGHRHSIRNHRPWLEDRALRRHHHLGGYRV